MHKYKKILARTHCDDTKSGSEIIVEKLKDLRKNVYNMTMSEFAAGMFPSYEISNIESYNSYSKKIYIKELTDKYDIDSYILELNENISNVIDEMLISLLTEKEYKSKLIDRLDDLNFESNYTLIVRGLNYLLLNEEEKLDMIVKKLLNSSDLFDRVQSNLLIIISTGLEILKGNYILAYETINLLKKYNVSNKYMNLMYEYYIAKTCFYVQHNIYTLTYLDKFLSNKYSRITPAKYAEISEYKLVLMIDSDVESAIEYSKDNRLLVNSESFNILTDIINKVPINNDKFYDLGVFEIITLFSLNMLDTIKFKEIQTTKEVEKNLMRFLEKPDDLTILRRFVLPMYKGRNPYFYNIMNIPNIEELKSRSRYKEILNYLEYKPVLKRK